MPPYVWLLLVVTALGRRFGGGRSATVKGLTTKVVKCERCGESYEYILSRSGRGRDDSEAYSDLEQRLVEGCEPVPCPSCGWYQNNMVPRARRLRHRWMFHTALYLFLGSIVGWLVVGITAGMIGIVGPEDPRSDVVRIIMICLVGLGMLLPPTLLILRYCLCLSYDPNASPQKPVLTKGDLVPGLACGLGEPPSSGVQSKGGPRSDAIQLVQHHVQLGAGFKPKEGPRSGSICPVCQGSGKFEVYLPGCGVVCGAYTACAACAGFGRVPG
jgi:hypothetical protein